jgi:REP element-mobilizing transposase RayT
MWNLPPPPGFRGLREDLPLTVYVRHLPHWRQAGATYFVTFRLADSLPKAKLDELAALRREWERAVGRASQPVNLDGLGRPSYKDGDGVGRTRFSALRDSDGLGRPSYDGVARSALEQLARDMAAKVEHWLDEGHGSCLLRDSAHAAHLIEAMHHFDGQRYELGAYVVMPNHVHAIVKPTRPDDHPLEDILGGWKQFSAKRIHVQIGGRGELWQDESYDRIIRDEEHLYYCLQYIGRNPGKANLSLSDCPRWIRPQWQLLGWDFEVASRGTRF